MVLDVFSYANHPVVPRFKVKYICSKISVGIAFENKSMPCTELVGIGARRSWRTNKYV